jgi:SHS2 domain-containing protein
MMNPEDRSKSGITVRDLWRGGASTGGWRNVCQIGSKQLAGYENNGLAKNLASLWIGKKQTRFAKCIEELITARNKYHHNEGPRVETEFREAADRVSKLLDDTLGELLFLTDHPIRLIRDFDVVRGTRRVVVRTLVYVGDHPGMRQEQTEYREALTKNDLYIQIRDGYWLPLYPFITVHDCPRCRYRETYYIDRWDGPDKKANLKSFERGHTEENVEVGNSIGRWGNAVPRSSGS